jgi:divalent metal cation (Fe/Co/Zn/Cd) transporter
VHGVVADAWNDTADILAAGAALTAVLLAMYDSQRFLAADHYGGFAVGVIVILTALRVLREASVELMDTMPDQEMMRRARDVAESVNGVFGVDKITRARLGSNTTWTCISKWAPRSRWRSRTSSQAR